jgi:site-specific DNA recombinase
LVKPPFARKRNQAEDTAPKKLGAFLFCTLIKDNLENTLQLNRQLQELNGKLERLEERFILEEINHEMFLKYQAKFKEEKRGIAEILQKSSQQVSNLEECMDLAIDYAGNLSKVWSSVGYKEKSRLQHLLFPEGIRYSKRINICRTPKFNSSFLWIAERTQALEKNKVGIPELNLTYPNLVENIGVEPMTSCMPCKHSSQLS